MKRIRLLEVVNDLAFGGAEKTLQILVKYLNRDLFDIQVAGVKEGGPREDIIRSLGVPVHVRPDLTELVRDQRIDVVHVHRAGWPEPEVLEAVHAGGAKAIVETNVFGRVDDSPSGRLIDRHLFVSYFCMRRYQGWVGRPLTDGKHHVLYNPIDMEVFDEFEFNRDESIPSVGRISRADNAKWSAPCIDMVPHLVKKVPDLRYYVIGETPEVMKRIQDLGVSSHFECFPPVANDRELCEFYNRFLVYLHGSKMGETFGCTIAEAMASGIPVVTHNCFGGADNAQIETVDHGITGFVADTPEDYTAAVAALLTNPALRKEMGEAGRKKVRNEYEARKITQGLEQILTRVYEEKTRI